MFLGGGPPLGGGVDVGWWREPEPIGERHPHQGPFQDLDFSHSGGVGGGVHEAGEEVARGEGRVDRIGLNAAIAGGPKGAADGGEGVDEGGLVLGVPGGAGGQLVGVQGVLRWVVSRHQPRCVSAPSQARCSSEVTSTFQRPRYQASTWSGQAAGSRVSTQPIASGAWPERCQSATGQHQ